MKLKRKELNKVEKLARKKLIKEMIIIYSILFLVVFLLFLDIIIPTRISFSYFPHSHEDGIAFIIIVLFLLLSAIIYWFLRKPEHMKYAYKKIKQDESKKLVEEKLIPLTPTKITIINTRNGLYKNLPDTETYAILGVNVNEISIYAQSIESKKYTLLDIITKEEFTTYCKILDDNSKE